MKKRNKIISLSFLLMFLSQILIISGVLSLQNSEDLPIDLNCKLNTNSSEIHNNLMPTGTYNFFEQPRIDSGTFSLDIMNVNINKIQRPVFNSSDYTHSKISDVSGNQTVNSTNGINEYDCSKDFDTVIKFDINYTVDYTMANKITGDYEILFHDDINSNSWNLYGVGTTTFYKTSAQKDNYLLDDYSYIEWIPTDVNYFVGSQDYRNTGMYWKSPYWYVVGDLTDKVYVYNSGWSYTGTSYSIGSQNNNPKDIWWDGSYWWMLGSEGMFGKSIFKYNSDWSYTGNSYDVSGQDNNPEGITWDGTNWWMLGDNQDTVFKYTSDWSYTGDSYPLSQGYYLRDIFWDGTYFWTACEWYHRIYKYNSDWSYMGSYNIGSQNLVFDIFIVDGSNRWIIGDSYDRVIKFTDTYRISKDYFGGGYTYMQTHISEGLNLKSSVYSDVSSWSVDYFVINCKTTTSNEVKLRLLKDGSIVKDLVIIQSGNTNFTDQYINVDIGENIVFDQLMFSGSFVDTKYFKCYDIELRRCPLIQNIWVDIFEYSVLGLDYNESFQLNEESINYISSYEANLTYYFDSSVFSHFNNTADLTIKNQNTTLIFDLSFEMDINISFYISWSSNEWVIPTDIDLTINDEEVVDQSYNSGFVGFDSYPDNLVITATDMIYFELNITIIFTFSIDLEIISKTHLHKTFELLSDHLIIIESIGFDVDLNLKKIYLNSIEYSATNPSLIDISMDTGNTYYLDVILTESIYRPLNQVYNNLGSGTYDFYISGITNHLTFNDYTRFDDFSFILPDNFNIDNMNLTFSDMKYNPYYWSNESENIHDFDFETQSYTDEEVNWLAYYYYSALNGVYYSEYNPTGNYLDWIEDFSAFESWMHHEYYPSDQSFNGSSYSFGSILLQNRFPNDFYSEDFSSWSLDFNSSYTDSSFSGGNFSSYLNTGSETIIPVQGDFTMIDGIIVSTGDLGVMDNNFTIIKSTKYIPLSDPLFVDNTIYTYGSHSAGVYADMNYMIIFELSFNPDLDGSNYKFYIKLSTSRTVESLYVGRKDNSKDLFGAKYINSIDISGEIKTGISHVWINTYDPRDFVLYIDEFGLVSTEEIPAIVNFTVGHQLDCMDNETIDFLNITWGYNTISSQTVNMSIYDFENSKWYLINSNDYYGVISLKSWTYSLPYGDNLIDYLNGSNYIRLKIEATNSFTNFNMAIDVLRLDYDYIKTSGDISAEIEKNINFPSFLDLYDSDGKYQKLFNITTSFQYKFSNDISYSYFAYYDSESLNTDGSWHSYSDMFIYDSQSSGGFNKTFNITNGLLELKNINYTIWFICKGSSIDLYQLLTVDNQFDITDYHSEVGISIINITYSFINTTDEYIGNYSNGIDSSQLRIQYNLEGKDTGWHTYNYTTNSSESLEKTFNATYNLDNDFSDTLKNYTVDFYLLGNSTELTLYNISLYDHDISFDSVNEVSINDVYLFSNQELEISFNGTDPHISHFTLNETCLMTDIETTIYNISISNNVLYTWTFNNNSLGNYSLWFIFYDIFGNYEKWIINITILSPVSINIGYENPIYVNQNGTINIHMYSDYYINESYYSNSSDYIQYSNTPSYNITFSFNVIFNTTQYYNISAKSYTEYGVYCWVNVTGLFVAKRTTIIDFIYFTHETEQDDNFITEINLRETIDYQNIQNLQLNYSIIAPNDTIIIDSNQYTNENGTIDINISLSLDWEQGFYNFNCSFLNTTDQYLWYWQMWSFEIFPIERIITNSSVVNLTVNSNNVIDNSIQINNTILIAIDSLDNLIFDLGVDLFINHSNSLSYSEYIDYTFRFNASIDFTYINVVDCYLDNIPINFTRYYYNNIQNLNYILSGSKITINEIIGKTLYNDNSFSIGLRYFEDSVKRTQLTSTLRTDTDSVLFEEYYTADSTFDYWYFVNSLDIISVSLDHIRTGTIITSFDNSVNESNYYYFEEDSISGDLYESTIDYNPNWVITSEVTEKTTIYSKIKIDYKADLDISGVSIILSLTRGDCFSGLTLDKNQSTEQISIVIPSIEFSSTTQTLYIEGFRTQKIISSTTSLDYVEFNEEFRYGTLSLVNNTIDIDPNYYVNYDVIINNGTYSKINIDYKADLSVNNINVSIDLSAYSLYNENWTHNTKQSHTTYILKVPHLDFTASIQTISLEGYSSVPDSVFNYYINEETIIISENNYSIPIYYRGYLTFNKYSMAFFVKDLSNSWTIDGVHYLNNYYTINTITGFFRCEGFDPSISSAYLRFKAIPISGITRIVNSTGVITYIIDCDFPIDNAILMFTIEESNRFTLETPDDDVLELYDVNDVYYYYYLNLDLEIGINYFVIKYTIYTLADDLVYLIPLLVIIGIVFILYWRTRRKEKKKKQIEKEKKWYEFWKWRLNVKGIKNVKNQSVKYMKNIKRKGGKKR